MVIAWKKYTKSICSGCGHSRLLTTDPDYEGFFRAEADSVTCAGCMPLDVLTEHQQKAEHHHPAPGSKVVVEFILSQAEAQAAAEAYGAAKATPEGGVAG